MRTKIRPVRNVESPDLMIRLLILGLVSTLALSACASSKGLRPITSGAEPIEKRDVGNLRKDQPILIHLITGSRLVGKFEELVGEYEPSIVTRKNEAGPVRLIRHTKRIPDWMSTDLLTIHVRTFSGIISVPMERVDTILLPTHSLPCEKGEFGCLPGRFWSKLNSDLSTWCPNIGPEDPDTFGYAGIVAGNRYWPDTVVSDINSRGVDGTSVVTLDNGSGHRGTGLRFASDSTSWQPKGAKNRVTVSTSKIGLIEFVERAGLAKGLESSARFVGEVAESASECEGDCTMLLLALPVVAPLAIFGTIVSGLKGGYEETVVYSSAPICLESAGVHGSGSDEEARSTRSDRFPTE